MLQHHPIRGIRNPIPYTERIKHRPFFVMHPHTMYITPRSMLCNRVKFTCRYVPFLELLQRGYITQ